MKGKVMSEQTNPNGKRPSHTLWFAPKRENARWMRIGSLWPTKNGNNRCTAKYVPAHPSRDSRRPTGGTNAPR